MPSRIKGVIEMDVRSRNIYYNLTKSTNYISTGNFYIHTFILISI